MPKFMIQAMKYTSPLLAAMLLGACASAGDSKQVPSYAHMFDSDTYQVICHGISRKEVYVRYDALDAFLREDGSEKTREEFCREDTFRSYTS